MSNLSLDIGPELWREDSFAVIVKNSLLSGSLNHFLRIDAYPKFNPVHMVRHYGYWDIPMYMLPSERTEFSIRNNILVLSDVFTNEPIEIPFAWGGDFVEPGPAVWHVSIWSNGTGSSEPERVEIQSVNLMWNMNATLEELVKRKGWIDRTALPALYRSPEFYRKVLIDELRGDDKFTSLNMLINYSRFSPKSFGKSGDRDDEIIREAELLASGGGKKDVIDICLAIFSRTFSPSPDIYTLQNDEYYLRSRLRTGTDDGLDFILKMLLIDTMYKLGKDQEAFQEFKHSWEASCMFPYLELTQGFHDENDTAFIAFRPCCTYGSPEKLIPSSEVINVEDIWNSPEMCISRLDVHAPGIAQSGCSRCTYRDTAEYRKDVSSIFDLHLNWVLELEDLSPLRRKNMEKLKRHYIRGDLPVEAYPAVLYLSFGFGCNIRCIMCSLKGYHYKNAFSIKRLEQLQSIIDISPHVSHMTLTGGEILIYPLAKQFVCGLLDKDPSNADMSIDICTNGLLLEQSFEWLLPLQRLGLFFSMDGVGRTYELIRQKSDWNRVESAVLQALEYSRTIRPKWRIKTAHVMMKSSLPGLPDLVNWICRHDIRDSLFSEVFSFDNDPVTQQEDLIRHPEGLRDIPAWRDILQESIDTFARKNMSSCESSLQSYYDKLLETVRNRGLESEV